MEFWVPGAKGATIAMDDQRHMKFVVRYPTDTPPYSFSKSWTQHTETRGLPWTFFWFRFGSDTSRPQAKGVCGFNIQLVIIIFYRRPCMRYWNVIYITCPWQLVEWPTTLSQLCQGRVAEWKALSEMGCTQARVVGAGPRNNRHTNYSRGAGRKGAGRKGAHAVAQACFRQPCSCRDNMARWFLQPEFWPFFAIMCLPITLPNWHPSPKL